MRDGFLADDTPEAVVLRTPGAEDQRIARGEIKQTSYLNRSMMPEGLETVLKPQDVADLLAWLRTKWDSASDSAIFNEKNVVENRGWTKVCIWWTKSFISSGTRGDYPC